MLHKQEADELGAHLKKIVDTERKADQIGRRLTVKRGVYLWGLRACWWVPFIKFALMQIIDGVLPTPITIHMLFYIGSSARWQPPPERWRRVLYLYAGVTIWARHLGGIGPGPRARARPGRVPTFDAPGRPRGPFALRPRDPLDRPVQKWGAIFSQCQPPGILRRRNPSLILPTRAGAVVAAAVLVEILTVMRRSSRTSPSSCF